MRLALRKQCQFAFVTDGSRFRKNEKGFGCVNCALGHFFSGMVILAPNIIYNSTTTSRSPFPGLLFCNPSGNHFAPGAISQDRISARNHVATSKSRAKF
jgi:hypothetical protein